MRLAGTINDERQAERFADYLLLLGVEASASKSAAGCEIWIRDETQVEKAKQELARFLENPLDERYAKTAPVAKKIRKRQDQEVRRAQRNLVDARRIWAQPVSQRIPGTLALILFSIAVTLFSDFGDRKTPTSQRAYFTAYELSGPNDERISFRSNDGIHPDMTWAIEQGEWWRLFTPMFLHLGLLHLLFNMMWLHRLGGLIEMRSGSAWLLVFAFASSAIANVAQAASAATFTHTSSQIGEMLGDSPFFGGMSGVNYALFGYIWMKAKYDRGSNYFIDRDTVGLMIVWFFLCLFGLIGNVANAAHGAGFAVGLAAGYASAQWQTRRRFR
jgi:GlpG protein